MKRKYDKLDLGISTLIGMCICMLGMGKLAELKYEPRIAELNEHYQAMLTELTELQDTCPESMVCYEPYGTGVEPEYVLQGAIVKVDFVTEEQMAILADPETDGYAEYIVNEDATISLCKLTVIMPERVLGDPQMDTIGHEFLHCVAGDFHP